LCNKNCTSKRCPKTLQQRRFYGTMERFSEKDKWVVAVSCGMERFKKDDTIRSLRKQFYQ